MTTYRDLLLTRPAYPPLVCADGAQVSLQAGYGLYSTPRDNHGPYTHVEAGFPSVPPPASWRPYAEFGIAYADDPDLIAGAIYAQLCAQLPWACVDEFIALHGGVVSTTALPPRADAHRAGSERTGESPV